MTEDWRALNRAARDERMGIHLGPRGYELDSLRAGRGRLDAIEEVELGAVIGLRLQWLGQHPRITSRLFRGLVRDADECWTWPDRPWLPLSVSLRAIREPR